MVRSRWLVLRNRWFWFLTLFWTAGMAVMDVRDSADGPLLSLHFGLVFAATFLVALPFGMLFGWLMVRILGLGAQRNSPPPSHNQPG
jgi:hypothetical protein